VHTPRRATATVRDCETQLFESPQIFVAAFMAIGRQLRERFHATTKRATGANSKCSPPRSS
jgi:hypothetical protein